MNAITEEILMAYADGELSQEDMRRVAAALQETPALFEELQPFEFTRDKLADPYEYILDLPTPERLVRTVMDSKLADGQQRSSLRERIFAFMGIHGHTQRPSGGYFVPAWTLAASAVLVAGLSAAWLLQTRPFASDDRIAFSTWGVPAPKFIQQALDDRARGETATGAGEQALMLTLVASFRAKDGEYCRSYEQTVLTTKEKSVGLACRAASEPWRIKMEVAALKNFVPLGEQAQSANPLDAIALQHFVGKELSREEEAHQIKSHWGALP